MTRRTTRPFSLRTRFLLATFAVILAMTLSYGAVALVGYLVSFDKTTYTMLRSQSNLFYSLSQWDDGKLNIRFPPNFSLNAPSVVLIYDDNQNLLWRQYHIDALERAIPAKWLTKEGLYDLNTSLEATKSLLVNTPLFATEDIRINDLDDDHDGRMIHSVSVSRYGKTGTLPPLTIVVVDTIPQNLQKTFRVWEWFGYVVLANLFLLTPLIWLAAHWSLRPINALSGQISALEKGEREDLDETPPSELRGLVRNLNLLLHSERERYTRYQRTLSDLTHSLKTPLAVLQSTLRSLRGGKDMTIETAEPVMLEQIGRISQQVGYYLHRASIGGDNTVLMRDISSVPALIDSLASALSKVYQRKGVDITVDIPPDITWLGQQNDFMEVMGNIMENACKYCLEFVEVTAQWQHDAVILIVDDDGPDVPEEKRELIFSRGQRVDTLRPGQGLGLAIVTDILEQYDGGAVVTESPLGGARITVTFRRQTVHDEDTD
ncbi:two-component system sensor histidine kinase PhoQ [Morganella morganii]|uniref:two-component system sensor histidine kinase PhoQ n=1 Tax=Morganella morganii TaxID=582 RepID=UPI003323AB9E